MGTFKAGDKIINTIVDHDYFAIVKDIKIDGTLVVYNKRIGCWIADPNKCKKWS